MDRSGSRGTRKLRWRATSKTPSRAGRVVLGLACASVAFAASILLPSQRVSATAGSKPGPGDLVQALRSVQTMEVKAAVVVRVFPSSVETTLPTDGVPTIGTMTFRDSGKAWRIENDFDPSRVPLFATADSSFDGDASVVTYERHLHRASFTNSGEQDHPYAVAWHPWLRLGMWLSSDKTFYRFPTTRTDLFGASDAALDSVDDEWSTEVVDGGEMDVMRVEYGEGAPLYRIATPVGEHDRPTLIELYTPEGWLSQRVYFKDWKTPAWGENSTVESRALPHHVALLCYSPAGELLSEITTTITACSVDLPLPSGSLTTPLDGAESIVDEDALSSPG